MQTIEYRTPNASCGSCRATIAEVFEAVPGVESAVLDLETKRTTVRYDPSQVEEDVLVTTLTDAGYAPAT
jgi:P-type Cu2+ transporter